MRYSQSGLVINGVTGWAYGGEPVTVSGLTPNRTKPKAKPNRTQSKNARRLADLEKRAASLGRRIDRTLADAVSLGLLPAIGEPLEPVDPRPTVAWRGTRQR